MAEAIEAALARLDTLLRYVAPGFVAVGVFLVVFPDAEPFWHGDLATAFWPWLVVACLWGVIIYGLHATLCHLLVSPLFVAWHRRRSKKGKIDRLFEKKGVLETCIELDIQRWQRRHLPDEKEAFQQELDKWAGLLNFLYCCSYSFLVLPCIANVRHSASDNGSWDLWLFLLGLLLLVVALVSDWRITGREMHFMRHFRGWPESPFFPKEEKQQSG